MSVDQSTVDYYTELYENKYWTYYNQVSSYTAQKNSCSDFINNCSSAINSLNSIISSLSPTKLNINSGYTGNNPKIKSILSNISDAEEKLANMKNDILQAKAEAEEKLKSLTSNLNIAISNKENAYNYWQLAKDPDSWVYWEGWGGFF